LTLNEGRLVIKCQQFNLSLLNRCNTVKMQLPMLRSALNLFFLFLASAQAQEASPLPSSPSWVPNAWSMIEWQQLKFEEALASVTEGRYVQIVHSEPDTFCASVITKNGKGEALTRLLTFSRTAHSILIRKAILQKLGLDFPAVVALKDMRLKFNSAQEKSDFKAQLEKQTEASALRWITHEQDLDLELQDVLVSDVHLSAPHSEDSVIPFIISDLSENVNLLSWTVDQAIEFDDLHPSRASALKILNRLAQLSRVDWEFIARRGQLPLPVEKLLVEKLISRSESLIHSYQLLHQPIEFDPEVSDSYSQDLENGVLVAKVWPGFATQFSLVATGPISDVGGLRAFTRSKAFSGILGLAVKGFNSLSFLHTNSYLESIRHNPAALAQMVQTYNQSGVAQKTPLGVWGFGFATGQLILSRDVVAGSYLGTNNLLQIVDQVGVRLDLFGQLQLEGAPVGGPVGFDVSAGGDLAISRTYAHIKPIKNLNDASNLNFQDATLPFVMSRDAHGMTEEKLKGILKIGESLIITDSLIGNAEVRAAMLLYTVVDLSATVSGTETVLSRLHVFRKDADTFQVHQDISQAHQIAFALKLGLRVQYPSFLQFLLSSQTRNLSQYFQILSFQKASHSGTVTTQFYPVPLTTESLEWLRPVLRNGNVEVLSEHVKPYVIHNTFKEKTTDTNLIFFSGKRLKSAMELILENPLGEKREFVRDSFSKTAGRDFEKPSRTAVDYLLGVFTNGDPTSIFTVEAANPGYTMFGHAKNQLIHYEAEKMPDGRYDHTYVKVAEVFNGWKLSNNRLSKILDEISASVGTKIDAPASFKDFDQVRLYNISLNTELNENALKHLNMLSIKQIYHVYKNQDMPSTEDEHYDGDAAMVTQQIYGFLQEFKETHASKTLLSVLSLVGDYMNQTQLIELLGGKENIHIYTKFDGLALNRESPGHPRAILNKKDLVGTSMIEGPLSASESQLGMTDGEFLSQWVTSPAL